MNQCLRITFLVITEKREIVRSLIRQAAHDLSLEGTVRSVPGSQLKVIACGNKNKMDQFLEVVMKEIARQKCDSLEVEPFFKDKDYRGVFRVIE